MPKALRDSGKRELRQWWARFFVQDSYRSHANRPKLAGLRIGSGKGRSRRLRQDLGRAKGKAVDLLRVGGSVIGIVHAQYRFRNTSNRDVPRKMENAARSCSRRAL